MDKARVAGMLGETVAEEQTMLVAEEQNDLGVEEQTELVVEEQDCPDAKM